MPRRCWRLLLPALLLIAPGVLAQAACDAHAPSAAGIRQERERCLLQHVASRLSPDGRPVHLAADRKPRNEAAHRSHFASGLLEIQHGPVEAGEPAAATGEDWEATGVLGELNGGNPEPQEDWEADYIVDDQPPAGRLMEPPSEAIAAEPATRTSSAVLPTPVERHLATRPGNQASKSDALGKLSTLMEVHIPVRLRDLHRGREGPIPKFLRTLQQQLQVAAGVPLSRLVVLGVRGEYMNLNLQQIELLARNETRFAALLEGVPDPDLAPAGPNEAFDCKFGMDRWATGWSQSKKAWCCKSERFGCPKETVVDVEVLPASTAGEPTPASVMARLARQVLDAQSSLRQGPLSSLFSSSTLMTQGVLVSPEAPEDAVSPLESLRSSASLLEPSLWSRVCGPTLFAVFATHRLVN